MEPLLMNALFGMGDGDYLYLQALRRLETAIDVANEMEVEGNVHQLHKCYEKAISTFMKGAQYIVKAVIVETDMSLPPYLLHDGLKQLQQLWARAHVAAFLMVR